MLHEAGLVESDTSGICLGDDSFTLGDEFWCKSGCIGVSKLVKGEKNEQIKKVKMR